MSHLFLVGLSGLEVKIKLKSFSYTEKLQKIPILLSYFVRVYCGLFLFIIIEYCWKRTWIAGEDRREFASKATPDDDRWAQRCSLAKIAVGKPGTFIYMDSNLDDLRQRRSPDDDRRTQTAALVCWVERQTDPCSWRNSFPVWVL